MTRSEYDIVKPFGYHEVLQISIELIVLLRKYHYSLRA